MDFLFHSTEGFYMVLSEADQFLQQFDCLNPEFVNSANWDKIRLALKQVAEQSDYQILGICASSFAEATQALQGYATALGYTPALETLQPLEGSVYLKFNPRTGLCYIDTYTGEYRGVLVSCQSADGDGVNQMYGHLPLDLFSQA